MRFLLPLMLVGSMVAADTTTAPAAAAPPAVSDSTAAPKKYVPGAVAKIFILPPDTEWPPATLPKAPGEVVKLSTIPQVASDPVGPEKARVSNTLITSPLGILDGVHYYAVEFRGAIYAPDDGDYGFVVRSNGPYLMTIEGQEIVRSAYFFDFAKYLNQRGTSVEFANLPIDAKFNNTTQGTAHLAAGRYYQLSLTCYLRHGTLPPGTVAKPEVLKVMGAELAVIMTTPGGDSGPIQTYVSDAASAHSSK